MLECVKCSKTFENNLFRCLELFCWTIFFSKLANTIWLIRKFPEVFFIISFKIFTYYKFCNFFLLQINDTLTRYVFFFQNFISTYLIIGISEKSQKIKFYTHKDWSLVNVLFVPFFLQKNLKFFFIKLKENNKIYVFVNFIYNFNLFSWYWISQCIEDHPRPVLRHFDM